ncbi:MAG TPA: LuxR C-terminal-related transcriptional regulator [Thermoleophilaceae bacterium]|nr:LuxR C-terminal-related transcriptional regulator [Thermoleophilaceae bacterium]
MTGYLTYALAEEHVNDLRSSAEKGRVRRVSSPTFVGRAEQLAAFDESLAGADPFGLTPRERELLELVAAGRTNRQIGEGLFMSEKTASVQVSRILAKLEVSTRGEAGAVAHELGLDGA